MIPDIRVSARKTLPYPLLLMRKRELALSEDDCCGGSTIGGHLRSVASMCGFYLEEFCREVSSSAKATASDCWLGSALGHCAVTTAVTSHSLRASVAAS